MTSTCTETLTEESHLSPIENPLPKTTYPVRKRIQLRSPPALGFCLTDFFSRVGFASAIIRFFDWNHEMDGSR